MVLTLRLINFWRIIKVAARVYRPTGKFTLVLDIVPYQSKLNVYTPRTGLHLLVYIYTPVDIYIVTYMITLPGRDNINIEKGRSWGRLYLPGEKKNIPYE